MKRGEVRTGGPRGRKRLKERGDVINCSWGLNRRVSNVRACSGFRSFKSRLFYQEKLEVRRGGVVLVAYNAGRGEEGR